MMYPGPTSGAAARATLSWPSNCRTDFATAATAGQHTTSYCHGKRYRKSEAPTIVPQLTSQESAIAEQQTNQSLRIAENNLQSARGKNLNATQTDLVSKITGFIKDAREAAQITIGAGLAAWRKKRKSCQKNSPVHCSSRSKSHLSLHVVRDIRKGAARCAPTRANGGSLRVWRKPADRCAKMTS